MRKHKRTSVNVPSSSIVLDLKPVLKARNIKHPAAYLKKIGLCAGTVTKMLKGEAVQLNFDQLTKLCVHLNCTPNDLFALRDMTLPEKHQLHALSVYNPQATEPTIEEWMLGKSVSEIRELMG